MSEGGREGGEERGRGGGREGRREGRREGGREGGGVHVLVRVLYDFYFVSVYCCFQTTAENKCAIFSLAWQ